MGFPLRILGFTSSSRLVTQLLSSSNFSFASHGEVLVMESVTAPGTILTRLYGWARLTVDIYRNGLEGERVLFFCILAHKWWCAPVIGLGQHGMFPLVI